jgi:hypothetical protein
MIGITPDWFIERQRMRCPPKTRVPRTCFGRDGYPSLGLADQNHADNHGDEQHAQDQKFSILLAAPSCSRLSGPAEESERPEAAGENVGHDEKTDAVADAVFVDLLADPHQRMVPVVMVKVPGPE